MEKQFSYLRLAVSDISPSLLYSCGKEDYPGGRLMAAYGCVPITCSKPAATFQIESKRDSHPRHVTETGTKASTN